MHYMPTQLREKIRVLVKWLLTRSIQSACHEQGLLDIMRTLAECVPDISRQYSGAVLASEYDLLKTRAMHAFQVRLALKALDVLKIDNAPTIVDIGDSSGNHLIYLRKLMAERKRGGGTTLSVNLDEVAVSKIRGKGLNAFCCKAEDLHKHNIKADIFISFEMLEHLFEPVSFLKSLSKTPGVKGFVITVPYRRDSRVRLECIRSNMEIDVHGEMDHVFELCPTDWKLLATVAGWKVVHEEIYYQYALHGVSRLLKPYWKAFDYEGFYGMILVPDHTWYDRYKNLQ